MRDIVTEELAKGLDAYWRLSADDALDAVRANLVTLLGVRPLFPLPPFPLLSSYHWRSCCLDQGVMYVEFILEFGLSEKLACI